MTPDRKDSEPQKTLRRFGRTLGWAFPVLFGLGLPLLLRRPFPAWPWVIGLIFASTAFLAPNALRWPYRIWMALGDVLHRVNTFVIFTLLFFLVLFPLKLIFRLGKRDPLRRKWDPSSPSYRVPISDSQLVERLDNLF